MYITDISYLIIIIQTHVFSVAKFAFDTFHRTLWAKVEGACEKMNLFAEKEDIWWYMKKSGRHSANHLSWCPLVTANLASNAFPTGLSKNSWCSPDNPSPKGWVPRSFPSGCFRLMQHLFLNRSHIWFIWIRWAEWSTANVPCNCDRNIYKETHLLIHSLNTIWCIAITIHWRRPKTDNFWQWTGEATRIQNLWYPLIAEKWE